MTAETGFLLTETGENLKSRGVVSTDVFELDGKAYALYLLPDQKAAIYVQGRKVAREGFFFRAEIVNYQQALSSLSTGEPFPLGTTLRRFSEISAKSTLINSSFALEKLLAEQIFDLAYQNDNGGEADDNYSYNNDNNL